MKQISTFVNLLLAAVVVFLLLSSNMPAVSAQTSTPNPTIQPTLGEKSACDAARTVQVSGSALINVAPDRAQLQLGVQSDAMTVDLVEAANSKAMQQVIAALKAQGIDAKDISTDVYMIEPVYEDYNSLHIKGYRINNSLAVTVRDVKKTSVILAAVLKAGANRVSKVDFYTSELRKYRDQARELAVKAAKEKAQALAQAAGTDTSCVLSISENATSQYNSWWMGYYGYGNQNTWSQNVYQNAAPAGGASDSGGNGDEPLSLGQISVKAEVSVSFGLK